jgi:hypothetical protein
MRVNILFLAVTCGMALHAQADLFKQAPPDVDQSLRTRVNKFYQAYIDGKPRTAMRLVAEDTQDLWFDTDKPKYKSFELLKIAYSEDFRKADVTVVIEEGMTPRLGDSITRIPMTTTWRIDDGQWVYYVDIAVRGTKVTPFGLMKADPGEFGAQSGLSRLIDRSQILAAVKLDKNEVRLGTSDEVVITNGMPGAVNLSLEMDKFEGLSGTLERSDLAANAKTKVRFEFSGSANARKEPLQARIIVRETQQVIPVKIMFQ